MTMSAKPEHEEHLWHVAIAPTIWAAHFLASYVTVAIWCAKVVPRESDLGAARIAVAAYTAMALFGIAFTGWRALVRHRHRGARPPHDSDTPEDRHRFLGFAALLLSIVSAIAVVYVALPSLFIETCR